MVNYSLLQQVHQNGQIDPPPLTQFDLATVIDLLPVAVLLVGNNGLISHANPMAEQLLVHDLMPRLPGQSWHKVVKQCFVASDPNEHELTLHNGRLVSLSTNPIGNTGQILVLTDQTQTRQLQSRIAHQQRLSAMGQMVASLAHQIRTPLSTATLYCSNLLEKELPRDKQVRFLSKMSDRLQYLERHIRDMLVFARGEIPLEDNVLISSLLAELNELCEEKITVSLVIEQTAEASLRCNKDVLLGALMNVLSNAQEAGATIIQLTVDVANQAHFQVVDDGCGMDKVLLSKLNDAFVTTKSTGTGLGISVVRAVAKAHQGNLSIESSPDEGSTITLSLPIYNQESL